LDSFEAIDGSERLSFVASGTRTAGSGSSMKFVVSPKFLVSRVVALLLILSLPPAIHP